MTQAAAPHDWSQYGLWDMWSMLEPQSRADGQVAVQMWKQVHELCRIEANKIETALAKLRETWPITQSAAYEFQSWAKHWVTAMRTTAENARINGPIIDMITQEIDAARDKVAGLVNEALEYERMGETQAGIAYYAKHAVHGDWALTGWREGLSRQAREIMANLEQQVATYASGLAMEQPFNPALTEAHESQDQPLPARWPLLPQGHPRLPGGAFVASLPEYSDVASFDTNEGGSTLAGSMGGGTTPGDGPGGSDTSGTVLAGAGSPVTDPLTGLPIGLSPAGVGPGGSFVDTPAGRVLAPGGLLGPAVGNAVPGGLAGAAAARAGMIPMVPPIMGGQRGAEPGTTKSAGKRRSRKRSVPDIFQVGQGRTDVILPAEEPEKFDPGPNVFGIDR